DAAVLLLAELEPEDLRRRVARMARDVALVEHAERARGDSVPAAVADVLLHDDGAVLGPEERAGRADVEAGGVRAVLADVGAHQPAERVAGLRGVGCSVDPGEVTVEPQRLLLLDEGDVAPGVRTERRGVVVRLARPDVAVLRHEVPLLAGDLAGLAADADRRVGEEAHALLRVLAVGVGPGGGPARRLRQRAHVVFLT